MNGNGPADLIRTDSNSTGVAREGGFWRRLCTGRNLPDAISSLALIDGKSEKSPPEQRLQRVAPSRGPARPHQSTSVRNGEAGRPSLLKRFTSGTFAQP